MEILTPYFLVQGLAVLPPDDQWLSPAERARAAGFRFLKRRNDWLLGRWTAKRALLSFLIQSGMEVPDYASLEILSAPDGAPEAYYSSGVPAPVSLTLSHSNGQGFCAVARAGVALGCDLETMIGRDPAFVLDYFCDEERARIAGSAAAEQPLLATLIWSAKESALKCLREGLRRDTRSILVSFDEGGRPGWAGLSIRCRETGQRFQGWWREVAGMIQTLAADEPLQEPVELLR